MYNNYFLATNKEGCLWKTGKNALVFGWIPIGTLCLTWRSQGTFKNSAQMLTFHVIFFRSFGNVQIGSVSNNSNGNGLALDVEQCSCGEAYEGSSCEVCRQCVVLYRLSLVHTSDISIRSIRKQSMTSPLGLAKTKQREFFFVSPFVLLLAYAYDDPYVAGLTSFLCFAFCFALMLVLSCEPGFTVL